MTLLISLAQVWREVKILRKDIMTVIFVFGVVAGQRVLERNTLIAMEGED